MIPDIFEREYDMMVGARAGKTSIKVKVSNCERKFKQVFIQCFFWKYK